jgi:hypothetical protein
VIYGDSNKPNIATRHTPNNYLYIIKCEKVLSVESASVNAKESVSFREYENELKHILKSFSGILESGEKTEIKVLEDLQIVRKKISDTKLCRQMF